MIKYTSTHEHDWNQIWEQQMRRHHQNSFHFDCSTFWNNSYLASEYHRMTQSCHWKQSLLKLIEKNIGIKKNHSLVDIGAGPGVHSLPLSLHLDHIISVEPSKAMIDQLRRNIKDQNIENIITIQKKWEDININDDLNGGGDIVLSSFSLGMYDLKKAIQKMIDASNQYVFLIWHQGVSQWEQTYIDLWPLIYHNSYEMIPKEDVLLNLISQLGIHPQVQSYQTQCFYHFFSFSHALSYFTTELAMKNHSHKELLSKYLSNNLYDNRGKLCLNGIDRYVIIWWEN